MPGAALPRTVPPVPSTCRVAAFPRGQPAGAQERAGRRAGRCPQRSAALPGERGRERGRGRGGREGGSEARRERGQARPLGSLSPARRSALPPGLFVGGGGISRALCPPPRTASTGRRSPKLSGKCGTATGTCSSWAPAPTEPSGEREGVGLRLPRGGRRTPGPGAAEMAARRGAARGRRDAALSLSSRPTFSGGRSEPGCAARSGGTEERRPHPHLGGPVPRRAGRGSGGPPVRGWERAPSRACPHPGLHPGAGRLAWDRFSVPGTPLAGRGSRERRCRSARTHKALFCSPEAPLWMEEAAPKWPLRSCTAPFSPRSLPREPTESCAS